MTRVGRLWRPLLGVAIVCTLATAVGGATVLAVRHAERTEAEGHFDVLAARLRTQVMARMHTYEYGLRGLRGAVVAAGGESVTRRQMDDYSATRDVAGEFPGARGLGVVFKVRPADEARFVERTRRLDWPGFRINRLAPHDGDAEVIKFIEPIERNVPALGLDIASEPLRHAAARAAARDGVATLTAPITLMQPGGAREPGFLLLLPIFRPGLPIATPAQREAAVIGWSYAPLAGAEIFSGYDSEGGQLSLALVDRTVDASTEFFAGGTPAPRDAGFERRFELPVYGRRWEASVRATPGFVAASTSMRPQFLGGLAGLLVAMFSASGLMLRQALVRLRIDRFEKARRAAIVESSEDAIVAETLGGIITEWNSGAERLFGYPAAHALGRTAASLILPPERETEDALMRAVAARGERMPAFDTTRLHRDGTLLDVSITAAPVLDGQGRCVGFAKTLRDIRDTQNARRALSELNDSLEHQVEERTGRLNVALRNLRAIIDAVPSMIGYWDAALVNRVANRAYAEWFSLEPEALNGCQLRHVVDPTLYAALLPRAEAALRGAPQSFEHSSPTHDGEGMRHFLVHYMPDRLDGRVQGFYVFVHDVTEITENQRALATAQRENAAILETLHRHALVSVADRAGRIIDVNESFCRISGYSAAELRGCNHRIVNSGHHDHAFWQQMWGTISAGRVWRGEVCNRAKDGSLYWVDSVIAPFVDEQGRIEKYVSIRTDITPIKRLQQDAEDARQRATLASQAKSQFLANMSHEIRTPMNAVIGLTYLLQKTRLSDEQAGFANRIGLAGKSLLALINDILDLSKIEASEMRLESVPFSLRDVVSEVSAIVGAQAETKGIVFEIDIPSDLPDGYIGDPTRVRQVLLNLLGNSVKFTERGRVCLAVTCETPAGAAPEGAASMLALRVTDTGIGIASHQLEHLFQPFVQADTSTTRQFGGTGLGLSIVRELVELMGGRVNVCSELGQGTVFVVHLGLVQASPEELLQLRVRGAVPSGGQRLAGLSLLVVDDSEINLEVARRILEGEGCRVAVARNGLEALESLRAHPGLADMVLMDVQMPVMDGHDATRRIRDELGLKTLPVVALTAGITVGEKDRATAAGMNGVVGKPFEPDLLVACILDATRPAGRPASTAPSLRVDASNWPAIDGIDAQDCARRLGGDTALLRKLLAHFLADSEAAVGVLEAQPRDAEACTRLMHNMKGSAATLGARRLSELAARAEQGLLDDVSWRDAAVIAEFEDALRGLQRSSAAYVEASADVAAAARPAPPAIDRAAVVDQLGQELRLADFAALTTVRDRAGVLRDVLGASGYEELCRHCDALQFRQALALLEGVC
jgi:PAS domain S-box-containing protein